MRHIYLAALAVVLCLVLLFAVLLVRADVSSEAEPTRLEALVASGLLTTKLRITHQREQSPIAATSADIDRGKQLYQQQCSFCHGEAAGKPGMLASSFSPRPPQFAVKAASRPTWMNAYLIRHGIRWSAMPSFGNLSEADAWRIALYLDTLKSKVGQNR